jgi:sortase A
MSAATSPVETITMNTATSLAGRPSRHTSRGKGGPSRVPLFALVLAIAALGLLGGEMILRLKAVLAGHLIERALSAHLCDGRSHPPWGWADHHPIARLEAFGPGIRQPVLSSATGSSLAFGAGHLDGTAGIGQPGNCVIAGHRDTVFEGLQRFKAGDSVALQTATGKFRYRVKELLILDKTDTWILDPTPTETLTLLTCYPFDSLIRGPRRYAVVCERVAMD